jgi:transposase
VVAPTLVPMKSGDRVKTNRRDAEKLARCDRSGDLTPVWVPDAAHEALRDLVRAREAGKKDQLRARHRLAKFLLRRGLRTVDGVKNWTTKHLLWIRTLRFEHRAQEATFLDYLHEMEHQTERVRQLDRAIDMAIESVCHAMRALMAALLLMSLAQVAEAPRRVIGAQNALRSPAPELDAASCPPPFRRPPMAQMAGS